MAKVETIFKLKNVDASIYPEQKLRKLVEHLQDQMNNTYVYWVGEWGKGRKARSTRNGKIAGKKEVIDYLEGLL